MNTLTNKCIKYKYKYLVFFIRYFLVLMGNEQQKIPQAQFTNKIILHLRLRTIILHHAYKMKLEINDVGIFPHRLDGLKLWETNIIGARYAIINNQLFKDQHVLEINSSVGICGIAIRKWTKAKSVTISDYHDEVLLNIKRNCQKNQIRDVMIFKLDFKSPRDFDNKFDVIIANDLLYTGSPYVELVNIFEKYLKIGGRAILIMPQRQNDSQKFFDLLNKDHFETKKYKLIDEEYDIGPLANKVESASEFPLIGETNFIAWHLIRKLPLEIAQQKIQQKVEHHIQEKVQPKNQEKIQEKIQEKKQQESKIEHHVQEKVQQKNQEKIQEKIQEKKQQESKIEKSKIQGNQIIQEPKNKEQIRQQLVQNSQTNDKQAQHQKVLQNNQMKRQKQQQNLTKHNSIKQLSAQNNQQNDHQILNELNQNQGNIQNSQNVKRIQLQQNKIENEQFLKEDHNLTANKQQQSPNKEQQNNRDQQESKQKPIQQTKQSPFVVSNNIQDEQKDHEIVTNDINDNKQVQQKQENQTISVQNNEDNEQLGNQNQNQKKNENENEEKSEQKTQNKKKKKNKKR